MKNRKGHGCDGSPRDRVRRHWLFGGSIGLVAATAFVCLLAHAQERDTSRPDSSPELAGPDNTLLTDRQLTDGAAPDAAIDANQAAAILDQRKQAFDASGPPEDTGQVDLAIAPPGTVTGLAGSAEQSTSPVPNPGETSTVPASATSIESPMVLHAEAQERASRRLPYAGLGLDLGVSGVLPDTGLLLTLRPGAWLHLQLGAGYNGLSPGLRAGVTLINPIVIPLSLTLEGGHYYEGDGNTAVHWFSPGTRDVASLRHFSYDYLNLHVGLAFESRHFCFYVRGGVTWMRTTVKDFSQSVHDIALVDLQASDPKIQYRGPSAKIGFIVFP